MTNDRSGSHRLKLWAWILSALGLLANTHAQSDSCGREWHLVNTHGSSSPASGEPLVVYDSRRHVAVLFAGNTGNTPPSPNSKTWEWNGVNWALRVDFFNDPSPAPGLRAGGAMAYDETRGVCVLYGGYYDDGDPYNFHIYDDTWEWDGSVWTERYISSDPATIRPPPKPAALMAYDTARQRTVLFDPNEPSTTWEWDGINWSQHDVPGPSKREGTAMAYDPIRRVTVLFGGSEYVGPEVNDTWTWNGTNWNLVQAAGPPARSDHAMAFDTRRNVIVMFGGHPEDPCSPFNDLWEWNGQSWSLQTYSTPSDNPDLTPIKRFSLNMWYDTAHQNLVIYRGTTVTNVLPNQCSLVYLTDMWEARPPGLWGDFNYPGLPSFPETGEFDAPFNTLAEAVNAASLGCAINLKTGSRAEAITISKQLQLEAYQGPVTIGQ